MKLFAYLHKNVVSRTLPLQPVTFRTQFERPLGFSNDSFWTLFTTRKFIFRGGKFLCTLQAGHGTKGGSKAAKEAGKMAALQVADYLEKDALILTPGQAAGGGVFSFVRFCLSVGGVLSVA